jgi:hypothetical protein
MCKTLCAVVVLLPMFAFAQSDKSADTTKHATTQSSPTIVASVKLTNQTAESGPITLVTPSVNTLYRITGYMEVTQTNDLGGIWCTEFGFTDPVGPKVNTKLEVNTSQNDGQPGPVTSTVIVIEDRAGVPLTYSIGICAGTILNVNVPFDLFFTVEKLQ